MNLITCPVALTCPPDMVRLREVLLYYLNGRDAPFAIFSCGTCAFSEAVADTDASARSRLTNLGSAVLDGEVREMDDGNFLVRFSEHVVGLVFGDEFKLLRATIISQLEASAACSEELILRRANNAADHVYIGLFARTRLFRDQELLNIVARNQAPTRP